VLAVAGTTTSRLLFRGSAGAHQVSRTPRVLPPVGIRAPAAPRLTGDDVRAAAEYLSLDEIREGDPPSAVISGQEVDAGSIIQVEGDPPIDFRIAAIERAVVRLVVDATDPPTEVELVKKR
jgi:hypothetical protein